MTKGAHHLMWWPKGWCSLYKKARNYLESAESYLKPNKAPTVSGWNGEALCDWQEVTGFVHVMEKWCERFSLLSKPFKLWCSFRLQPLRREMGGEKGLVKEKLIAFQRHGRPRSRGLQLKAGFETHPCRGIVVHKGSVQVVRLTCSWLNMKKIGVKNQLETFVVRVNWYWSAYYFFDK